MATVGGSPAPSEAPGKELGVAPGERVEGLPVVSRLPRALPLRLLRGRSHTAGSASRGQPLPEALGSHG